MQTSEEALNQMGCILVFNFCVIEWEAKRQPRRSREDPSTETFTRNERRVHQTPSSSSSSKHEGRVRGGRGW